MALIIYPSGDSYVFREREKEKLLPMTPQEAEEFRQAEYREKLEKEKGD